MAKKRPPLKIPEGWDVDSMKKAAALCTRIIDAYNTDAIRTKRFDRYLYAQQIFDDERVPSNLEIIQDVDPKNYPLLRMQVMGAARMVVSAFNGADPFYIFSGGPADVPSEIREAREHDTQLLLEADNYTTKIRESARLAAIKARGTFRTVWEERKSGDGWTDSPDEKSGEYEFVGPCRESMAPDDFGIYPLSVWFIHKARAVWHRFDAPMFELWEKQARGEYFSEELIERLPANHEQKNVAEEEEDYAPNLYSMIVKLPLGMDKAKPLKAYRVTLYKTPELILFMEPYDKPTPDYFAPAFRYDPLNFWPSHSIGSSVIEMQAEVNDVQFARLMASIAAIKRTVLASGYVGDMTTHPLGMGDLMMFRGDPKFTVIDTGDAPGSDLAALANDAKLYAQGDTGFTEVAAGQLPEASQTATATGGALQGTADEGEEKRTNFIEEEIRNVQYIQTLVRRNFKALKSFYGDRLKTTSAKDWDHQFTIAANGQGPNNNPTATLEKLKLLQDAFTSLGIPYLEDVEAGIAPNIGIAISKKELAKSIEQNLDLSMNTEKIIVDTSELAGAVPPIPDLQASTGIGGPQDVLGLGGSVPPELLGILGGGGQMPIPDPMAFPPPSGMPGGMPLDPFSLGFQPPMPIA